MAESRIKMKVVLELDKEEAYYIKQIVQNPTCAPAEESPEEARIRQSIWNALPPLEAFTGAL